MLCKVLSEKILFKIDANLVRGTDYEFAHTRSDSISEKHILMMKYSHNTQHVIIKIIRH